MVRFIFSNPKRVGEIRESPAQRNWKKHFGAWPRGLFFAGASWSAALRAALERDLLFPNATKSGAVNRTPRRCREA